MLLKMKLNGAKEISEIFGFESLIPFTDFKPGSRHFRSFLKTVVKPLSETDMFVNVGTSF